MVVGRASRLVLGVTLSLGAGACSQWFDISHTELLDARYFDAGIDAPFACPPTGQTPLFSRTVVQAVFQPVFEYTTSSVTGRAMGFSGDGIMEGPIDQPMAVIPQFASTACLSCTSFSSPRLTPEGDGMYAVITSAGLGGRTLVLYRFDGAMWTVKTDFGATTAAWVSNVTTGSARRMITSDGTDLHELEVTDDGAMTDIGTYTPTDLGIQLVRSPMLTSDGLHLVVVGTTMTGKGYIDGMYYADRSDLGARFSMIRPLADVPVVDGAYVTENCSRIYLSGLGSLFYAPRI